MIIKRTHMLSTIYFFCENGFDHWTISYLVKLRTWQLRNERNLSRITTMCSPHTALILLVLTLYGQIEWDNIPSRSYGCTVYWKRFIEKINSVKIYPLETWSDLQVMFSYIFRKWRRWNNAKLNWTEISIYLS